MSERVIVVGAGIVGLTCAVQLAEAGYQVNVLARDLPGETASSLATAPWLPPAAHLGEEAAGWARTTREVLTALADGDGDQPGTSGVRVRPGRLLRVDGSDPEPDRADVPVVAPVPYLRGLTRRLLRARGTLTRMALPALPDPMPAFVVNCTGVASRALVPDPLVVPRTRCVVRLVDPGLQDWTALVDDGDECRLLIVPDGLSVMVSGDDSPPSDLVTRAIAVEPRLAGARVLSQRTAVRAERAQVRIGHDAPIGGTDRAARVGLLHNYGHGTAGLSLSWGCAAEVLSLLTTVGAA